MNSKIVIAFIAGAVIASGIVYIAVKEDSLPRVAAVPSDVPVPAGPKTAPRDLPAAETPAIAPPPPAPVVLKPTHREKPSPMPPPFRPDIGHDVRHDIGHDVRHDIGHDVRPDIRQDIRHERPLIVAGNQAPPSRPAPPPIEAQIPNEPAPPPPAPVPAAPEAQAPAAVVPSAPAPPAAGVPPTVTIAAGTILPVRIGETISAAQFKTGDSFLATLDRPLVVDGWVIAEKGSRLEGRVVDVASGRLRVELVRLSTSDGQHVPIRTDPFKKDAGGSTVADAAFTRGRSAEIPVESRISFRVAGPVTITERVN
jgi:hypothetical protein